MNAYITQRKVKLNISRNKIKILIANCFAVPLLLYDITPTEYILHKNLWSHHMLTLVRQSFSLFTCFLLFYTQVLTTH